ncbi:MAG: sigma-54 dependent transcriptional regulator [Rhodothermales bacterium]
MADKPHLLFVDDEHLLHNLFERLFTRNGFDVTCCASALRAMELMAEQSYDMVVTDFMMPDMDGFSLLSHIREKYPSTRVIMVTAHANVQHAVRMMQHGAIDYIPKPFTAAELVDRVKKSLATPIDAPKADPAPVSTGKGASTKPAPAPTTSYVGESAPIQRLKDMIPRVAQNKAPVFIQGASGTGKEILARLIHESSDRASGPYLTLNCANLPRDLVESHLFGHRKGAFTGAIEDMTGAFERADGGTLLLDEITEIDLPIQAKLLRVLQEQEIQKIGASEVRRVNVRVIATSNRNLSDAIADGIFREDLYHRLAVFPLSVPPLRDRMTDVPVLAEHFVRKYCSLYGLQDKQLDPALVARLQAHTWPGNVRELENMIQRGVLLSAERPMVQEDDVYDDFFADADASSRATDAPGIGKHETIEDMERYMILEALAESDQNQQQAADKLGVSARTIRNKLKKYRDEGLLD